MGRYDRNGIFTELDMENLKGSKVCVVGCGGLGGYIIEMLARVGIGHLSVIDGDVFDETNLNRQLLSTEAVMGKSKAETAKERVMAINSEVTIIYHHTYLNENNVASLIMGHDLVMDALDSIDSRFILQRACETLEIPMIHGAVAGWYGQVSTIYPGDQTLDLIYGRSPSRGIESQLGNPSFTPATIASIQVAEGLKVLTGKMDTLRKKLLYIDLLKNDYEVIELGVTE